MVNNTEELGLAECHRLLRRHLRVSRRNTAAWRLEAELSSSFARDSSKFVRAFEGARCDAALITDSTVADSLPDHPSDKFFKLLSLAKDAKDPILLPVEFKSFVHHVFTAKIMTQRGRTTIAHGGQAVIQISHSQLESGGVLVVGNFVDPDYVAIVPISHIKDLLWQTPRTNYLYLGRISPNMTAFSPLPACLAPFVMHKKFVEAQLNNLLDCLADPSSQL